MSADQFRLALEGGSSIVTNAERTHKSGNTLKVHLLIDAWKHADRETIHQANKSEVMVIYSLAESGL